MYSKFYTYYYAGMFLLGLVSLVTAFIETCPSTFFIVIESILCICMMLEIITRAVAMQRSFLTSWWNYFDIVLVLFCGVTLILMSKGGCSSSSSSEELINTILLVIRNAAQVFRLLAMIRKNRRQMDARGTNVDLDDGEDFLGIINDMDGLALEADGDYHLPGARGANDDDFRLSIDSLADLGGDAVGLDPNFDLASSSAQHMRRSDSRSSATSVRSNSDRLTGRKRAPGGGS
ncbi:hypothetical protein EV174_000944 [Coemansia sp. RSA 2320]|nr:hypothetical protein EV174_000944 [Coemansia sp. RSA 2320]